MLATSAKWFFNSIFEQIQKLPFFLRIDNLCQYIGWNEVYVFQYVWYYLSLKIYMSFIWTVLISFNQECFESNLVLKKPAQMFWTKMLFYVPHFVIISPKRKQWI